MIGLGICILIALVYIGGLLGDRISRSVRVFKAFLSFSGAYLLSISVMHLLPSALEATDNPSWQVGAFILCGFVLQHFLEGMSGGIEHGHDKQPIQKGVYSLVFGLCIHAGIEGIGVWYVGDEGRVFLWFFFIGLALHKAPVGLVFTVALRRAGLRGMGILFPLTLFALSSPVGMGVGYLLSQEGGAYTEYFYILFAMISGMFLHISTRMFLESAPEHAQDFWGYVCILGGIALAFLSEYGMHFSHAH